MTTRRLRAPDRRRQIVEVATRIFTEYGLDAARTNEITRQAGVTQPVLYQHFASKEELYAAAVVEPLDGHLRSLVDHARTAVDEEPSRADRLRRIEEIWVDAMIDAGPLLGAVMFARREVAAQHYREIIAPRLRELADLLNEHVLPPGTDQREAWLKIRALFGMNMLIVFDAMQRDEQPEVGPIARDLNRLLSEGQSGL